MDNLRLGRKGAPHSEKPLVQPAMFLDRGTKLFHHPPVREREMSADRTPSSHHDARNGPSHIAFTIA